MALNRSQAACQFNRTRFYRLCPRQRSTCTCIEPCQRRSLHAHATQLRFRRYQRMGSRFKLSACIPHSASGSAHALLRHPAHREQRVARRTCFVCPSLAQSKKAQNLSALGFCYQWSAWRDSNSRPLAPHASALPGCATRRQDLNYIQKILQFRESSARISNNS